MEIDYQKKAEEIVAWIQKTVWEAGFADVVVALSGGIDSAVSATLTVRALGKEHVHVLLLPYGDLSIKGTKDALSVAKSLGLSEDHIIVQDIQSAVDTLIQGPVAPHPAPMASFTSVQSRHSSGDPSSATLVTEGNSDLRKGNIMARVRMIYLYDFAKAHSCLVVGTENKSEYYLGYFTRFGDEASDIEPIRSLYKTQVWKMGKYVGVPQEVIEKAPSAGLWEGQSDEAELGFSYKDADEVLFKHFDKEMPEEEIAASGISQEIVKKVLAWVQKMDFKHHLPRVFE